VRPMGVILIALYHFLAAACRLSLAIALAVGGSVLGAMLSGGSNSPLGGWVWGFFVGIVGAAFTLGLPSLLSLPAMACGRLVSGDAFYASYWSSSPSFSPFPACCSPASISGSFWVGIT
jgi:hypothetical protein